MWIILAVVLGVLVIAGVIFAFTRGAKAPRGGYPSTRDADDTQAEDTSEETEQPASRYDIPDPSAGRLVRLRARLARSNNMLGKGFWLCSHEIASIRMSGMRSKRLCSWLIWGLSRPLA